MNEYSIVFANDVGTSKKIALATGRRRTRVPREMVE